MAGKVHHFWQAHMARCGQLVKATTQQRHTWGIQANVPTVSRYGERYHGRQH